MNLRQWLTAHKILDQQKPKPFLHKKEGLVYRVELIPGGLQISSSRDGGFQNLIILPEGAIEGLKDWLNQPPA